MNRNSKIHNITFGKGLLSADRLLLWSCMFLSLLQINLFWIVLSSAAPCPELYLRGWPSSRLPRLLQVESIVSPSSRRSSTGTNSCENWNCAPSPNLVFHSSNSSSHRRKMWQILICNFCALNPLLRYSNRLKSLILPFSYLSCDCLFRALQTRCRVSQKMY